MSRRREFLHVVRQLVDNAVTNRQWWIVAVIVVVALGVILSTAIGAAAPHTLYSLF